jgi:hypothetical protein
MHRGLIIIAISVIPISFLPDPTNEGFLDVIERAQFIVCLDQSHPNTSQLQFTGYDGIQDYQKSILANRVLHGNGSKQNSSNRWFDTAVQVNQMFITIHCHVKKMDISKCPSSIINVVIITHITIIRKKSH